MGEFATGSSQLPRDTGSPSLRPGQGDLQVHHLAGGVPTIEQVKHDPTLLLLLGFGTTAGIVAMTVVLWGACIAVVGIKVKAIANARSNETLGVERLGSGVLIPKDGLVLTIGYLILEADQVEVIDGDGQSIPAAVVAADAPARRARRR